MVEGWGDWSTNGGRWKGLIYWRWKVNGTGLLMVEGGRDWSTDGRRWNYYYKKTVTVGRQLGLISSCRDIPGICVAKWPPWDIARLWQNDIFLSTFFYCMTCHLYGTSDRAATMLIKHGQLQKCSIKTISIGPLACCISSYLSIFVAIVIINLCNGYPAMSDLVGNKRYEIVIRGEGGPKKGQFLFWQQPPTDEAMFFPSNVRKALSCNFYCLRERWFVLCVCPTLVILQACQLIFKVM